MKTNKFGFGLSAVVCACIFFSGSKAQAWATNAPDILHVPALTVGQRVPLVVVLHGCATDAASTQARSKWSELADEQKFVVLYPSLRHSRNKINCWSWYDADSQTREGEETLAVMTAIKNVVASEPVDPSRIFITGMSAGAAMVANLLSCYPEVFAGGAIHSGMSYGLAHSWQDALRVAHSGPNDQARVNGACDPASFRGGLMVVHGTKDAVMNPKNALRTMQDFVTGPSSEISQTTVRYTPKAELYSLRPYPYTITDFSEGSMLRGRAVFVEGLGHKWSGSRGDLMSDTRGPSATRLIWDFFAGI